MDIELQVRGNQVEGQLALPLPPGIRAAERDRLVDAAVTQALFEAAQQLGVVLAADPHAYAHPLDGKDSEGRTRFVVRGRVEGDRLVPIKTGKLRRQGK